ncbi:MAG: DUF371 domain-containing protein, partial [Methanopyraceae archaeon]
FKRALRSGARVEVELRSGDLRDRVVGRGDPRLKLSDEVSMVFRRSDYVDERTVLVRCDKAARDLDRRLVRRLRDPDAVLEVRLRVLG